MLKKIAWFLQFVIAIFILLMVYIPSTAQAENTKSPSLEDYYGMSSDFFNETDTVFDIEILDKILPELIDRQQPEGALCLVHEVSVRLFRDIAAYPDCITLVKLTMPVIPGNLQYVIITDGNQWFGVPWEKIEPDEIILYVEINDLFELQYEDDLFILLLTVEG